MQVEKTVKYGRPALYVTNATLIGRNTDFGWFILGYQRLPKGEAFGQDDGDFFAPNMPTGVNIVAVIPSDDGEEEIPIDCREGVDIATEWFSLKPLEFAARVRREINSRLDD